MQAIAEMAMIKAQGDREQAMSEAEWKQLSNLIENDRRERVCLFHVDSFEVLGRGGGGGG